MKTGILSLVSASRVLEKQLDTVANNLANVNTTGFKGDQLSFREVLSQAQRTPAQSQEEQFLSHEYLDLYVGMDKSAVTVDEAGKNFSPGRMQKSSNPLDVAIANEGFFTVMTPQGVRYTRVGKFQLNEKAQLSTHEGNLVLGKNGPLTLAGEDIVIDREGGVSLDGKPVDTLQVVRFVDPSRLQKLGKSMFAPVEQDNVAIPVKEPNLQQGMTEGSNVDTVKEMVQMVAANRSYETVQKALSNIDGLNEKALSIVRT